jgi:hypothetical protein
LSTLQAVSPLGQSAFFASLSASSLSRSILRIRPLPLADGPKTETTPGPPQNCAVLPGHGWLHVGRLDLPAGREQIPTIWKKDTSFADPLSQARKHGSAHVRQTLLLSMYSPTNPLRPQVCWQNV